MEFEQCATSAHTEPRENPMNSPTLRPTFPFPHPAAKNSEEELKAVENTSPPRRACLHGVERLHAELASHPIELPDEPDRRGNLAASDFFGVIRSDGQQS